MDGNSPALLFYRFVVRFKLYFHFEVTDGVVLFKQAFVFVYKAFTQTIGIVVYSVYSDCLSTGYYVKASGGNFIHSDYRFFSPSMPFHFVLESSRHILWVPQILRPA